MAEYKMGDYTEKQSLYFNSSLKKSTSDMKQQWSTKHTDYEDEYEELKYEERKGFTLHQHARLVAYIDGIPQLHSEQTLHQLYMDYDSDPQQKQYYLVFWQQLIDRLYQEVFMHFELPRFMIHQSFIVHNRYPSCLKQILDDLIDQGALIRKEQFLKKVNSNNFPSLNLWKKCGQDFEEEGYESKTIHMDEVLINVAYLQFVKDELIKWATISNQNVMTYKDFENQILTTFDHKKSCLKVIKNYLKSERQYDSHCLTPENIKIVKVGGDGKLNKFDSAFFRLRQSLKSLTQVHNDSKKIKEKFLLHLYKKSFEVLNNEDQIQENYYSFQEKIFFIERIGLLDRVISRIDDLKVNYLENNVNKVIWLMENQNQLSAFMLTNTILKAVLSDIEILQEINVIIDNMERSFDHHELNVLQRYGILMSEKEQNQVIAFYLQQLTQFQN